MGQKREKIYKGKKRLKKDKKDKVEKNIKINDCPWFNLEALTCKEIRSPYGSERRAHAA